MFYYLCRIVNVTASLIYPTYASYKALKPRSSTNTSSAGGGETVELERWAMYWCVMGIVWMWEDWGEWGISWFPFYYEFKTLVILWLVLPQIQGSTYLYQFHLSPFLSSHERDIDSFVSSLTTRAKRTGIEWLNRLIQQMKEIVLGAGGGQSNHIASTNEIDRRPPPVLAEPFTTGPQPTQSVVLGMFEWAQSFARDNLPMAIVATKAFVRPLANATTTTTNVGGGVKKGEKEKREERKKRLEAELAALSSSSVDSDGEESSSSSSSTSNQGGVGTRASGTEIHQGGENGLRSRNVVGVPPSLSPGHPSSSKRGDPVAKRYVETNLGTGGIEGSMYEEIGKDEVQGYSNPMSGERRKSGGWFGGWGGASGEASLLRDERKKKDS